MTVETNNAPLALTPDEGDILHRALHHAEGTAMRNLVDFMIQGNDEAVRYAVDTLKDVKSLLSRFHAAEANAEDDKATFPNDGDSLILMTSALVAFAAAGRVRLPNIEPAEARAEVSAMADSADSIAERMAAFVKINDPARVAQFAAGTSHRDEDLPGWDESAPEERAAWERFKSLLADGPAPVSTRLQ